MEDNQLILTTASPTQSNLQVLEDIEPLLQSPLLQAMVWPLFLLLALLILKKELTSFFDILVKQIGAGASFRAWSVEIRPNSNNIIGETSDLKEVETIGSPDRFKVLIKAQGISPATKSFFIKSTKAMEVPGGCIIQVSSEVIRPDGSSTIAEALTFVPGKLAIKEDVNQGRYIALDDTEL